MNNSLFDEIDSIHFELSHLDKISKLAYLKEQGNRTQSVGV